jgi:LEA14-like dessication related protein
LSAFAALLALAGCNSIDAVIAGMPRPSVNVQGVRLENMSLEDVELTFDVQVKNPYAFALPLTQVNYGLASGGEQAFIDGRVEPEGSIPARKSRVIAVPVRLNYMRVLNALSSVQPGDTVPYVASLDMVFDPPTLDPITLPLRHEGELPVPAAPRVRNASMDWTTLGLSRAEGRMQLELDNLNSFGIEIRTFDFDLSLGGISIADSRLAEPASFAAKGTGRIDIPISLSAASMGLAALNMLRSGETDYALSGRMHIITPFGEMNIPWNQRGRTSSAR